MAVVQVAASGNGCFEASTCTDTNGHLFAALLMGASNQTLTLQLYWHVYSLTYEVLYACADPSTLQIAAVLPTSLNDRTAGRRCMLRQPTAAPLQREHCWSMVQTWKPQTR
jgi:hypothetical protein